MSNQQVTLFQQETNAGPSRALAQLGLDQSLGEGIRSSFAILSIKGGRWRIKYKKTETPIVMRNQQTGRDEPVPTLEMVIIRANGFLNKQYYAGKYVEGSNAPPDCYSLDGKVPSSQSKAKQHTNCAMCPKNQWGSRIGDNGQKQKACSDTKKLAVVPLADIRNASLGGAMLFRVPPTALGDVSKLADAMKARGYPYNSVAVRFSFDIDAQYPKPQFNAIRPLTDDEAEMVLELYNSDSTAAVLADNEIEVEHAEVVQNVPAGGGFEQEPTVVPVGPQAAPVAPVQQPAQVFTQPAAPAPAPAPVAQAPAFVAPEAPTTFAPAFAPPPPPPGMHGAVVQPFNGGAVAPPPMAAFAQPAAPAPVVQQAPVAPPPPPKARKPKAEPVAVAPVVAEPAAAPVQAQLDADVNNILAGLSAFTGGAQ